MDQQEAAEVVLKGVDYVHCTECSGRGLVESDDSYATLEDEPGMVNQRVCRPCNGSGMRPSVKYRAALRLLGLEERGRTRRR